MNSFLEKEFIGKVFTEVIVDQDGAVVIFKREDGETFIMKHFQDCCESVYIEDIAGDVSSLIGTPICMAEEVTNCDEEPIGGDYYYESYLWTYYKFATTKGYVTFRWYGSSNGYYSEGVSLYKEGGNKRW